MGILDGARGRKFFYSGPDDHGMDEHVVVAADLGFWLQHVDEIEEWVTYTFPQSEIGGCVITLQSYEEATIFLLRWA